MTTATALSTLDLFRHLGFLDRDGYLCVFSGERAAPGTQGLTGVRQRFVSARHMATWAEGWIGGEALSGRETYFSSCLWLTKDRGKHGQPAPVQALWADGDGCAIPDAFPPTAVVWSSPGRPHLYWRLKEPIAAERAASLSRRIAYSIGADTGGWDIGQLLRPIGTPNFKYADAPRTEAGYINDDQAYDVDALDALIPALPPGITTQPGFTVPFVGAPTQGQTEPPVNLSPYGAAVWRGEVPRLKEDGSVDQSATLFRIGAALMRAGAAAWLLPYLLAERDATLGWNKYSDRPEEYSRIAAKLASEPRGPDDEPPITGWNEQIAALTRQVDRRDATISKLQRSRRRLLGKMRPMRRRTAEAEQKCSLMQRWRSYEAQIAAMPGLPGVDKLFAVKFAHDIQSRATATTDRRLEPGLPIRIPITEEAPKSADELIERADARMTREQAERWAEREESRQWEGRNYSYTKGLGCGASSVQRAVKDFSEELGIFDTYVTDPEWDGTWITDRHGKTKKRFTRHTEILLPDRITRAPEPGLAFLQAVIEKRPADALPVRAGQKPKPTGGPCHKHPDAEYELQLWCANQRGEAASKAPHRIRVLETWQPNCGPFTSDPETKTQIDATRYEVPSTSNQNEFTSNEEDREPRETPIPLGIVRAFPEGVPGGVESWCALCRGIRRHRHDPAQPGGVGACLACGGWGAEAAGGGA